MVSRDFCQIFKNTFSHRTLLVAASVTSQPNIFFVTSSKLENYEPAFDGCFWTPKDVILALLLLTVTWYLAAEKNLRNKGPKSLSYFQQ